MELYYVVNGKKYLDNYLIREKLNVSKSLLQHLINHYPFNDCDMVVIQNRKLYSIDSLKLFVENLLEENERKQIKRTNQ